jgi:hypothetical protein
MYSLVLLAVCKAARDFISPEDRVSELDAQWRLSEKGVSGKKWESRRHQQERQRKRQEAMRSRKGSLIRAEEALPMAAVSEDEYKCYLEAVEQNQVKMKQWADSAPCNFRHQYILVEARRESTTPPVGYPVGAA